MADGGQVSGRRGDLIKNCSVCNTKERDILAVKYCFMCEEILCQECTTKIESEALKPQSCLQHAKALNFYCKEHDSIGCDVCISSEHGSCKGVVYLQISANDVLKDVDITEVKRKLRTTINLFESIKLNQQETATTLESDREKYVKNVNDLYTDLLDILKRITQSSKHQIELKYTRFRADLQRHHQEVEKCLVDLKSSKKRLERFQSNDLSFFVELKKCQTQLKATEEVSTDSLGNMKDKSFSVDVDDRLHSLLSELESLVIVSNQEPVQVKKKYQIDVPGKVENKTSNIFGTCVLDDGTILLADSNNKTLTCVDQRSLKVKEKYPLQNYPMDVCVINSNEVAVTQNNKTVVIASVRPRLTITRTISMNHHCTYVSYTRGELYITDNNKTVYIYSIGGSLLRKVSTGSSGQELFSQTRHIMVSGSGDKIYIADFVKGLIILDREGQVQYKLINDTVRGIWGLCLDGMGGVFVSGFNSNSVVHVSAEGQVLTEVLTTSDGLLQPLSLCYDRLRKRLIVTQNNSNQIHVCELV